MQMKKPPVLYHSSANPDIDVFEPRNDTPRHPTEGPLVFATPHKAVAAMFLAPKDGGSVEIGVYGDRYIIIVNNTAERLKNKDKGGAIYELPSDTFPTSHSIGMQQSEWVSEAPVKPLKKEIYSSSLDAMANLGVEIFFVDHPTFKSILTSSDHGFNIINQLEPFAFS